MTIMTHNQMFGGKEPPDDDDDGYSWCNMCGHLYEAAGVAEYDGCCPECSDDLRAQGVDPGADLSEYVVA